MNNSDFIIRKMSAKDIASVAEIEKECFSSPWTEHGLSSELSNASAEFYVLEADGVVAAYMGMHIVLDECYITNVAVKGDFRKKATADSLLKMPCVLLKKKTAASSHSRSG